MTRNQYLTRAYPLDVQRVFQTMPFDNWLALAGGSALIGLGLARRSPFGILLALIGGGLVFRALELDKDYAAKLSLDKGTPTAMSIPHGAGIRVEKSIVINRAPEDLYRFWRHLENLPLFMNHLDSVTETDYVHSHWVVKAPVGMKVEWDAEIIHEVENELIGWRSLEGAMVPNAGSVHFDPAPNGYGTRVHVVLRYNPPAGRLGALFAQLFGEAPAQTIAEDLWRFKQLMEAGESEPVARREASA